MAEWEDGGGRGGDKAGKVTWGRKSLDSTLVAAGSCDSHELSSLLVAYLRDSQSVLSQKHSRGLESELGLEAMQATCAGLSGRVQLWACRVAGRKQSFGPRSCL